LAAQQSRRRNRLTRRPPRRQPHQQPSQWKWPCRCLRRHKRSISGLARRPATSRDYPWKRRWETNVSTPTIAIYPPPPDIDTGAAVLVCPGGGFRQLAFIKEGTNIAHWLNSVGITAIVLKYRVPARPGMPRFMAALQDAQRAICIIRSNAAQWHIDPHRLGMIGFSAGGQMVADVTTNYDKLAYPPIDAMDQQSTRPDFALAIYPGGIAAKDGTATVTPDVRPTKDTPPTFIVIATDDRNGSESAVYYYLALKKGGVNAELHVFSEGNHGFALRPTTAPHGAWPTLAVAWMNYHGFLKAPPATQP
jgi:acetyl esterase/lipase